MRQRSDTRQQSTADWADQGSLATGPEVVGSEDIHVRNYDHQWGYDLSVEVVDDDGDVVFEQRYYLQPGRLESELDVVPAGEYEIRATLDNLEQASKPCRIDAAPEHTVVIEVGNGALSLTEGLAG